jgi:transposase
LTAKIHALVDACGLPILLKITEGQAHDGRSDHDMLGSLDRGDILIADRAYDSDALRLDLATHVALAPTSSSCPTGSTCRPSANGSIASAISSSASSTNSFFNKLKHFRAIATRYDKRDDNYLAAIKIASARIWMRFNESMT